MSFQWTPRQDLWFPTEDSQAKDRRVCWRPGPYHVTQGLEGNKPRRDTADLDHTSRPATKSQPSVCHKCTPTSLTLADVRLIPDCRLYIRKSRCPGGQSLPSSPLPQCQSSTQHVTEGRIQETAWWTNSTGSWYTLYHLVTLSARHGCLF